MKTLAAAAATLALLMSQAIHAQATGTGATGTADASNTVNVVAITGPQADNTHAHITSDGHTWTTPDVQGSYFGGANPCLVGTGGGAAGGPIGFNISFGRNDEGCTRRSDAAAWHALGFDNVAVARMCAEQKDADAFFAATGFACPGTGRNGRYKLASGEPAPEAQIPQSSSRPK